MILFLFLFCHAILSFHSFRCHQSKYIHSSAKVDVISGSAFQISHANLLPLPTNADVVSHPINGSIKLCLASPNINHIYPC